VADYPNGLIQGGYNLSHQINSAVFLKAYSLMSGYGLEWTVESAIDNPDFVSDTSLVEGGCSNLNIVIKFNVLPRDTMFIRLRIDNASLSDYTITPPLVQDSLIMIPDSVMEWPMTITAIDDGIPEGTNGIDKWFIRYQMDPCDVPTSDTGGWGTGNMGYTGLIKVNVRDYNPFNDTTVIYGPTLPPPSSQYHCGGDVTVTIADILTGGIPPYIYSWTNPPQFAQGATFTTKIKDSPDYAYCTITDRCTGKPGYVAGKDTVEIRSYLTAVASPSIFQLCQNGHTIIKVANTNVGRDFNTIWYFQGNQVGTDSIYDVTWAEYGQYAPDVIDFICVVTDECGNTASDTVQASFFPVVSIQGIPLICLYDQIHLTCSPAQEYQWYYDSYPGTPITGETSQDLYYTPPPPGNRNITICVRIKNECGEFADTCFTFYVDELHLEMKLDNSSTDFSVCPNVPFNLKESSGDAVGGWEWSWADNGPHTATGQSINLSLTQAGLHTVQVIAYNSNGCYDTIQRDVTVFPYSQVQAFTDLASICTDNPAQLSATTGPVNIVNYYWSANPPDPSLAGKQNLASPIVFPQVTTTYQCKIMDNNGCFDSTTVVVNVREKMAVNIFANPDSSCTEKPVQVDFQTIVAPLTTATYAWTFDDGVPSTYNAPLPPPVIWSNPGLKTITLTIQESGCDSTFIFHFMVNPDPLSAFSASNSFGCQPVEATFTNASTNLENPTYLWEFGDGATSTDVSPTHIYPDPGHFDVTLTVTNATGCINTFTLNDAVEVYEVPVADFTADPQSATIDNPTINFAEDISIPFTIIDWNFGDSTSVSGEPNPRHTYGAVGNYIVVMYTETEHGCWDRDTLEIGIVEDIEIFVPNAFSPNGDGLNDCFSVGGTTGDVIDIFRIIIYNRWGGLIYDSPISDPNCVWDGRDMNGVLVTPETYVFRIFGKNFRGAKKVYEGMIMIVK
jgi:gliding motility-associated-like protein